MIKIALLTFSKIRTIMLQSKYVFNFIATVNLTNKRLYQIFMNIGKRTLEVSFTKSRSSNTHVVLRNVKSSQQYYDRCLFFPIHKKKTQQN